MTLEEVSTSTKISVSKLRAMERDEIESLPGGIFTRGFVRSYAEAVGLDPQEALARFETTFPHESSVATLHATVEGRANEEFVKRQRTAKGLIWFAVLSAPLVVWLLAAVTPADRPRAAPGEAVSGEAGLFGTSGAESPPSPAAPLPVESGVRPDPPAAAPDDTGRLTMEILPTADCWVRASADGDTVIARVLRAGEREVVVTRGAIDLRIGNAGAFAFTVNRRPGRTLGASGEVVNLRITPSNYLDFVAD